jgi:protein SCO1/2
VPTSLLALLVALVTGVLSGCGGGRSAEPAAAAMHSSFAGTELPRDKVLSPDFALRDQAGRLVRLSDQRRRIVLVTFLYTHCPDVCPLVADRLNQALRDLGPARRDVRVLAVSVDPKGDTPRAVAAFARAHRLLPQFRYLIGTRAQLAPVWRRFGVVVRTGAHGTVDHLLYVVLVDRSGTQRVLFDSRSTTREIVHDTRILLRS